MCDAARFALAVMAFSLTCGCATMTPGSTRQDDGGVSCQGVQRAAGVNESGTLRGALRGAWLGMKLGAQSAMHCAQDGVCQAMALVAMLVGAACGLAHGVGDGAAIELPAADLL